MQKRIFCLTPFIMFILIGGFIFAFTGCSSSITSIEDISPYLAANSGGATALRPINLVLQIDLGTMTEEESGWRNLLDIIENEGKFIALDLSACNMNDTEFNPDSSIEIGKSFIVSIILPNMATSIADGTTITENRTSRLIATFSHFDNLKSFDGAGLTSIGDWAFIVCMSLEQTELPANLTHIGAHAFDSCMNLRLTKLPDGLISLGNHAFWRCTKLAINELPTSLGSVGDQAFAHCSSITSLTIPPSVRETGSRVFENWISSQRIIIQGPTTNWNENWQQNSYARIVYQELVKDEPPEEPLEESSEEELSEESDEEPSEEEP